MKKQLPKLKSDEELEKFLENDLSAYITAENFTAMSFEFEPKEKVVNLRMSAGLLDRIKRAALQKKMPYQKFIRQSLEMAVKK
ncbi:MAG: CopG family antitoxin [Pyrinomonadaceae bacterium]|nr:CopG family transcriptional regulator [Chloracidobacterium sp.]